MFADHKEMSATTTPSITRKIQTCPVISKTSEVSSNLGDVKDDKQHVHSSWISKAEQAHKMASKYTTIKVRKR